jgi:hypothetical protein
MCKIETTFFCGSLVDGDVTTECVLALLACTCERLTATITHRRHPHPLPQGVAANGGCSLPTRVTVKVPGTSANIGSGYDCIGMAVSSAHSPVRLIVAQLPTQHMAAHPPIRTSHNRTHRLCPCKMICRYHVGRSIRIVECGEKMKNRRHHVGSCFRLDPNHLQTHPSHHGHAGACRSRTL